MGLTAHVNVLLAVKVETEDIRQLDIRATHALDLGDRQHAAFARRHSRHVNHQINGADNLPPQGHFAAGESREPGQQLEAVNGVLATIGEPSCPVFIA